MNVKRETTPPDMGRDFKWRRHGGQNEIEAYDLLDAARNKIMDEARERARPLVEEMHKIKFAIKQRGRYRDRHLPAIRDINNRLAAE